MHLLFRNFSVSHVWSLLLSLTLGLPGLPTLAQGLSCLGGNLQHLSAAQRAVCSARLAAVRGAALRFGAPADWHFVMVCGEDNWKDYEAFSSRPAAELEGSAADTDQAARSTYFREASFAASESNAATLRLVAYEVAAIVLKTSDQAAIENQVRLWMRSPAPTPLGSQEQSVLRASR